MSIFPRDVLLKAKWGTGSIDGLNIDIIDRGTSTGRSTIRCSDHMILGRSFLTTEDGTMIPYHRIVRILDDEDHEIWIREKERSRGQWPS